VPFHGGFGLLTLHGVPKPTYRAFELLHCLGPEQLPVEGRHETVDAWVVRRGAGVTVLLANHALPRHPIEAQRVHVELAGAPAPLGASVERIDDGHANAKAAWLRMGQPEYLSAGQVEELEAASRLVAEPQAWAYRDGAVHVDIELPPHGVAAVTLELPGGGDGLRKPGEPSAAGRVRWARPGRPRPL
jgi:xylan 1,4-beta-xylosidase